MFGAVAAIGMGQGSMAMLGFFAGAIVGLPCAPALVYGLRYGPWPLDVALIAVPTTLAAFLGGRLAPSNAQPLPSMGLSITVYIAVSIICGAIRERQYGPTPPGVCKNCRYDRTGLAPSAVCPECGSPAPVAAPSANQGL